MPSSVALDSLPALHPQTAPNSDAVAAAHLLGIIFAILHALGAGELRSPEPVAGGFGHTSEGAHLNALGAGELRSPEPVAGGFGHTSEGAHLNRRRLLYESAFFGSRRAR